MPALRPRFHILLLREAGEVDDWVRGLLTQAFLHASD